MPAFPALSGLLFLVILLAAESGQADLKPMPLTQGGGQAVEGDMVSVNGTVVKLWGVDAPDAGQTCKRLNGTEYDCFAASKNALARLIGSNNIECYVRDKDSFGQSVGTCGVNGYDLGAMMIRDGWALSFHNLSPHYDRMEGVAQANRAGLWAGYVEAPWLWRSRQVSKK